MTWNPSNLIILQELVKELSKVTFEDDDLIIDRSEKSVTKVKLKNEIFNVYGLDDTETIKVLLQTSQNMIIKRIQTLLKNERSWNEKNLNVKCSNVTIISVYSVIFRQSMLITSWNVACSPVVAMN